MNVQNVRKWRREFIAGRSQLYDKPRSGRPSDSTSVFENIQQVRDLLEEDRRCSISELCSRLQSPDCSKTSIWRIIHEVLRLQKLSR